MVFWFNEPTILFNKEKIMNLWPMSQYSFTEKLNAITRLVILLTVLGYFCTRAFNILITGIVTLGVIVIWYRAAANKKKITKQFLKEGFASPTLYKKLQGKFSETHTQKPFNECFVA